MTQILRIALAGAFLATATGCAYQHDFSMPGQYPSSGGSSYGGYYGYGTAPGLYYGGGSGYYGPGHYSPFDYYYRSDPYYYRRGVVAPYPVYGYYPYPYAALPPGHCWDRNDDGRCDRKKHDRGDDDNVGGDKGRDVRDPGRPPAIDAVKRPSPRIPAVAIPKSPPPPRVSVPAPERAGGLPRAGGMDGAGAGDSPARAGRGSDGPGKQKP